MGWAVNLLNDGTILPSDSDPGTGIERLAAGKIEAADR